MVLALRKGRHDHQPHDRIVAAPYGPTTGPRARAFACGAHLAVHRAEAWNVLIDRTNPHSTRDAELESLRESWGVTNAEEWHEQLTALLDEEGSDPAATMALDLRRHAMTQLGRPVDFPTWRDIIARHCGRQAIPDDGRAFLIRRAEAVARYEKRFIADGLLTPGAFIHSMRAYDFGRAVNMAKWGYRAGFCDEQTAERAVLYAGEQCHRYYSSWADFSAGYVLGRLLRFDHGGPLRRVFRRWTDGLLAAVQGVKRSQADWYLSALVPHRLLMEEPASPWRQLPWSIHD